MMNLELDNPFQGLFIFCDRPKYVIHENSVVMDTVYKTKLDDAKKILGFYVNLTNSDSILPKDFKVKFH
jgi:hypothetical protein